MQISSKEWSLSFGISLLSVCAIFLMHIYVIESSFNGYVYDRGYVDRSNVEGGLILHMTHPVFAMRPISNLTIIGLQYIVPFDIASAYIIIFVFGFGFWASAVLIYIVARHFSASIFEATMAQVLFFLSFSVLFAFATNMHTYDEPMQYLLIFSAFLMFLKKKYLYFALLFFLSLLARETGVLLIPGFMLLAYMNNRTEFKYVVSVLCGVMIVFGVYYIAGSIVGSGGRTNLNYIQEERFSEWQYSFQNLHFANESIFMSVEVLGLWLVLAVLSLLVLKLEKEKRAVIYAFLLTSLINTPVTFLTARAQEARIFALPLVFVWPISGYLVHRLYALHQLHWTGISKVYVFMCLCASIIVSTMLAWYVFNPTHLGNSRYAFQAYLHLSLAVMIYSSLIFFKINSYAK